ncbi:MAG: uncharacterized protein KVP18_005052 [Porospora cf. gigantea A]|uniref:uncharacterized protein n=1 Tax=Porospora cf. gigantea A TaxID=2853593 RepID=UPI003559B9EF|nr:MAG: hypothetical protein KVP18_005052 [Porospora cf. gigantea A]
MDRSLERVPPENIQKMTSLVDNRQEHHLEAVIDRSAASVKDLISHITDPRLKQDLLVRMEVRCCQRQRRHRLAKPREVVA